MPVVLVVDDDPAVRSFLKMALRLRGILVRGAQSGEEAIELFRQLQQEIGVVLVDVRMPGLDGPKTVAALRQLSAGVRCYFMSGAMDDGREEELRQLCGGKVFRKPLCLPDLIDSLGPWLG